MSNKLLRVLLLLALSQGTASAINVGEITSMMLPGDKSLPKEVSNPTESARYVTLSVKRLSSPLASGVVIPMDSPSELLSSPAGMIMPAGSTDNFRFFYNGPQDDQERYYRLTWTDDSVDIAEVSQTKKSGQATTSAVINTILVVSPRKENFAYQLKDNVVTNTGNASFRVISSGVCKGKSKDQGKGCRERYYVMPGNDVKIKYIDIKDKNSRVGIWHGKSYINVK